MGKRILRARLKKNLFVSLLATDVVREVETLLGRQAVEDLDLEALELAVRTRVYNPRSQEGQASGKGQEGISSRSRARRAARRGAKTNAPEFLPGALTQTNAGEPL
jgi:hypothetical protein